MAEQPKQGEQKKTEQKQGEQRQIQQRQAQPREITSFEDMMNRMFEDFWLRPMRLFTGGGFLLPGETRLAPTGFREPIIDVTETDKEVIATAEMPGLDKQDIKVNITPDRLEISAEAKGEEKKEEKGYTYRERRRAAYYRAIVLPVPVDSNKSKATYNNGVLEVRMPKVETKEKKLLPVE